MRLCFRFFNSLNSGEQFPPRLRLLRFLAGDIAPDVFLLTGNPLTLDIPLLLAPGGLLSSLLDVGRIVASIVIDPSVCDLQDPVRDAIEENPVVRHNHDGLGAVS